MIAIRTLDEDSEQLSKFCLGVWNAATPTECRCPL